MSRARSRPTCTSPGPARIRTCRASSTSRTARSAFPPAACMFTGLTRGSICSPTWCDCRSSQILDEHGEPLSVSGELAVHDRQVGAVNIAIDSDNFEVIDNELGDVAHRQQRSRSPASCAGRRFVGDVRLEAARLEVDRILQLFYDPYSREALPDGRLGRAHGGGQRQRAKKRRARRWRRQRRRRRRREQSAQAEAGPLRRRAARSRRRRWMSSGRYPTTSCCAARISGRAARPARRSAT